MFNMSRRDFVVSTGLAETGQVEKAKENVALLQEICPAGCEELEDLQEAIAQAPKTN